MNIVEKEQLEVFSDEEQKKALSILQSLDGLSLERAKDILNFCKEEIKYHTLVAFGTQRRN